MLYRVVPPLIDIVLSFCYNRRMNESIFQSDLELKSLALAAARNQIGADLPIEDVMTMEGVPLGEIDAILADAMFQRYLMLYVKELQENGVSFKMKNRTLVEDLVPHIYQMVRDPDIPAASRIKGFETMARYAGYEAEVVAATPASSAPQFHITFNVPQTTSDPYQTAAIDVTSTEIPTFTTSFSPQTPPGEPQKLLKNTVFDVETADFAAETAKNDEFSLADVFGE